MRTEDATSLLKIILTTARKSALLFTIACGASLAANPVITTLRTADPSPHVWADGKVWLYCSHDQDTAVNYNDMDGYHVFSSSDLVHWTDHGEVLHSRNVLWGMKGVMYAPDCMFKNGKYYYYFPHLDKYGQWRVGIAISPVPQGPFIDSGYIPGTDGIDPCCFTDKDGQTYLYWGKGKVARLKDNMRGLAEPSRVLDLGTPMTSGFEGIYMHQRNGVYYLSWSDGKGYYSMGTSPYGPFVYKGVLNPGSPGCQDHHGILDYQGKSYYFYHVGNYNGGNAYRRNVAIDYLYYNADGTIKPITVTTQGVSAVTVGVAESRGLTGDPRSSGGNPALRVSGGSSGFELFQLDGRCVRYAPGASIRQEMRGPQTGSLADQRWILRPVNQTEGSGHAD